MRLTMIFGIAALMCGCGGAQVDIRNNAAVPLEDVAITAGERSAQVVKRIEPLAEGKTTICPAGEAGEFALSFKASGQLHRSEHRLYFECDSLYRIHIDVSSKFDATADLIFK